MFKHNRLLAVAIAAAGLLTSAAAGVDDAALTTQIVDTFYKIYGTHPGFRVNHAKGVVAALERWKCRGPHQNDFGRRRYAEEASGRHAADGRISPICRGPERGVSLRLGDRSPALNWRR